MYKMVGVAMLMALGACSSAQIDAAIANFEQVDRNGTLAKAYADAFQDKPFEDGRVYVVAEEHGDLHTYSLTPCRGGTHICGGSGHVGHLSERDGYTIVTGAYPGRTFFLSPGGDGVLRWRGEDRDLAWN